MEWIQKTREWRRLFYYLTIITQIGRYDRSLFLWRFSIKLHLGTGKGIKLLFHSTTIKVITTTATRRRTCYCTRRVCCRTKYFPYNVPTFPLLPYLLNQVVRRDKLMYVEHTFLTASILLNFINLIKTTHVQF